MKMGNSFLFRDRPTSRRIRSLLLRVCLFVLFVLSLIICSASAPFPVGQCLAQTGPDANGIFRGVKVYCDRCVLPLEYAALPRFDNRSAVNETVVSNTIKLKFDPPIEPTSCVDVTVSAILRCLTRRSDAPMFR